MNDLAVLRPPAAKTATKPKPRRGIIKLTLRSSRYGTREPFWLKASTVRTVQRDAWGGSRVFIGLDSYYEVVESPATVARRVNEAV